MNLLAYSPPGQRSARGIDAGFLEGTARRGILTLQIRNQHAHHRQHLLHHGAHGLSRQRVERVTVYDLMYLFHKGLPHGRRDEIDWNKRRLPARQALRASAASGDRNRGRAQAAAGRACTCWHCSPPGSRKTRPGRNGPQTGRLPRQETIRDQIPAHADSPCRNPLEKDSFH